MDLSVYNALSLGLRRDGTVAEVCNFLHAAWAPVWQDSVAIVTGDSVEKSVDRLCERKLIERDGQRLVIRLRGPNGLGPPVGMSEDREELMWRGKR